MRASILSKIEENSSKTTICIGLGTNKEQNIKIARISRKFVKQNRSTIIMIGDIKLRNFDRDLFDILIEVEQIDNVKKIIENIQDSKISLKNEFGLILINTPYPAELLIKLVFSGNQFSGVRGALSSARFLKQINEERNKNAPMLREIHRIALMETFHGHQFFFAPVGIDEAITLANKQSFITNMDAIFRLLNIDPNISVLSGGRKGDLGRNEVIDKTIQDANLLENTFKKKTNIRNDQILIENAIKYKSNFILAPDGISGNLIYRTLVHLGGGKAFGALYSSLYLVEKKIIIDCSRIANKSEIMGSLILASGFCYLLENKKEGELLGS